MSGFPIPRVVGNYISSVVILCPARSAVQSMLPHELELAPQTFTSPAKHPVVLSFNDQRRVGLVWGSLRGPAFDYLEFAVGIPYVQLRQSTGSYRGPFFFAPLLYLNSLAAILAGLFWGFAKHDARIKETANGFQLWQSRQGSLILATEFKTSSQEGRLSDFPFAKGLTELLDQPGIGKTILGPLLSFTLAQDWATARVQAIEGQVEMVEPFLKGLSTGNYPVAGLDRTPLGAYRMSASWWLNPPTRPANARPLANHH